MTENESIKKHIEDCEHIIGNILGFMENNSDADILSCEENIAVLKEVIIALEEIQQYRAIGTVEEFKALKENQRKCEDCAGCTNWLCDCFNERAKAVDEFVKEIEAEYDNDGCPNVSDYLDYKISIRDLQKIAEHLKGGAE